MANSPRSKNANNFLPSPKIYNNSTTFIQANTSSFKQIVQTLTGSSKTSNKHVSSVSTHSIPPIKIVPNKKQSSSSFRLYERRNSMKNLKINPMNKSGLLKSEILSPSILNFPSLVLSPVSPLVPDPFKGSGSLKQSEEKKGFYLIPSPRNVEPKLLPLFP